MAAARRRQADRQGNEGEGIAVGPTRQCKGAAWVVSSFAGFGQGLLVVLGVSLVVFVAMRVFGDPAKVMLPLSATAEQRAEFEHLIGLDRPLPEQFVTFLGDLVTLDFGESLWQRRPAMEVVFERLPNTLMLIGAGLGFAILLALPLGAIAALRPGGIVDRVTVIGGLVGLSTPQFWLGLLLIMFFAVNLRMAADLGLWRHLVSHPAGADARLAEPGPHGASRPHRR